MGAPLGGGGHSLFLDHFKSFDRIESSHIRFFVFEKTNFIHACATCSELPPNISSMIIMINDGAILVRE